MTWCPTGFAELVSYKQFPTNRFKTLELQDLEIGEFYVPVDQERRATDFQAKKWRKGSSGFLTKSRN